MSILQDLSGRKGWIVIIVCVILGLGYWLYRHRDRTLPPIVLKDSDGQEVTFEAMRAGKDHTVMVFLLPGCPISKFSMGVVKEQHAKLSGQLSFVGLLVGKQPAADRMVEDEELEFPVYGLHDGTDPFAINELIDAVGSSEGLRTMVYGGTVIVVNPDRKIVINLARDEVRELPEELAELVN